ncbi:replicase [Hosta virus X]|uniref:RNA replication protein n=1 Tax=Hosta virus X TaxID=214439 RepID=Q5GR28_9VIRU|nr:replicase [Hosta virus X]CAF04078.1 replicase [Hosta virus X]
MARLREVFSSFTEPNLKTIVQQETYKLAKAELKTIQTYNPYAQTKDAADLLEDLGINTNPHAVTAHTHAAAKSIENDLYGITSHYLPKTPITFLFMKRGKLQFFKRGPQHNDLFFYTTHEPKDVIRYQSEDQTADMFRVPTSTGFIGDTLHFLSLKYLHRLFLKNPNLNTLYATMVLPPEAMYRMASIYPEIYQIQYQEDGFLYIPGGHGGAAYFHTYDTLTWLRVGQFQAKEFTAHLPKVGDKGANHLFIIQRADLKTPKYRTFVPRRKWVTLPNIFLPSTQANHLFIIQRADLKTPKYRTFVPRRKWVTSNIFLPKHTNARKPILKQTMMQLFLYEKSVKEITFRDVFAKIRQLIQTKDLEQFDPDELVRLANYVMHTSKLLEKDPYELIEGQGKLQDLVNPIKTWVSEKWQNWFGWKDYTRLIRALKWVDVDLVLRVMNTRSTPTGIQTSELLPDEAGPPKSKKKRGGKKIPSPEPSRNCRSKSKRTRGNRAQREKEPHRRKLRWQKENFQRVTVQVHQAPKGDPSPLARFSQSLKELPRRSQPRRLSKFQDFLMSSTQTRFQIPSSLNRRAGHWRPKQQGTPPTTQEAGTEGPPTTQPGKPTASSPRAAPQPTANAETMEKGSQASSATTRGRDPVTDRTREQAPTNLTPEEEALPWKHWLKQLKAVGFKGNETQMDGDGTSISPIEQIKSCPGKPKSVSKEILETLRSGHAPNFWKPDASRARAYTSDIKNRRTGAAVHMAPQAWKETMDFIAENAERTLHILRHPWRRRFREEQMSSRDAHKFHFLFDETLVVCPTNELRRDWIDKLPLSEPGSVLTFERALMNPAKGTVIFDDYTKLPAGFIEAYSICQPNVELVILTGDAKQASHHESNDNAMIAGLDPAAFEFSKFCRYYLNATHRNPRNLANALGIYSEKPGNLKVTFTNHLLPEMHILVPSLLKKATLEELGHKCSTYAGCQGVTLSKVQIYLDSNTTLCSNEVLYTALSRAVEQINFVNSGPFNGPFWAKLEATPYLKTFLRLTREEKINEITPEEPKPKEPEPPKTHFPVETSAHLYSSITEEMPEKHAREIYNKTHGHTNCVQTDEPLVQMFAHQQAKDEALFWETIEARLRITTSEANVQELNEKRDIGDLLFHAYHKAMGLPKDPIPFENDLWETCAQEVQQTYLSKPINLIKNGEKRQGPDFDKNAIMLFLKSQWVKKMEKLGAPTIKPGQTIASFHQITVMLYGTMARYMRRIRDRFCPKHILINCEKTPTQISDFVKAQWDFSDFAYANDFTAFDQSQDGAMLQFEIIKAKFHNIPEDIILGYMDIKTNAKIFLGTLAIMRLTGEGPTFDANTECNIAYTHLRFNVPENVAQVYAGDDSALSKVCPEKDSFKQFADRLTLKSKPQVFPQTQGAWAEFCGLLITPRGIIKDPVKLHASWVLATKLGTLQQIKCVNSYGEDLKLSYDLGDHLQELLSESQCRTHQVTVRELVKFAGKVEKHQAEIRSVANGNIRQLPFFY